jgi:hypothetical protein
LLHANNWFSANFSVNDFTRLSCFFAVRKPWKLQFLARPKRLVGKHSLQFSAWYLAIRMDYEIACYSVGCCPKNWRHVLLQLNDQLGFGGRIAGPGMGITLLVCIALAAFVSCPVLSRTTLP